MAPAPPAPGAAQAADAAAHGPRALVLHEPPSHGQLALLALLGSAGLLVTAVALALLRYDALLLVGLFLCSHAVIVAASWLPGGVLSARLDQKLDKWVADVGGGYYGLMALAMFLGLELQSLWSDVWDFDFSASAIGSAALPWIIGFSIDSVVNGIKAAVWPALLFVEAGAIGALAVVGLTWAVFAVGSKLFPQPSFLLEKRRKRTDRKQPHDAA